MHFITASPPSPLIEPDDGHVRESRCQYALAAPLPVITIHSRSPTVCAINEKANSRLPGAQTN